jgi:Bacterial membrane protein YfhO
VPLAPTDRDATWTTWVRHVVGVGWVLAAAICVMIPALHHGLSLGEYDWLSSYGLLQQPGVLVHNAFAGDQINEMIPWTTLAWTQVHAGHLPLWNPYSALGLPLTFNWQSATFSLPNLIGYLFPVRLIYTVQVLSTLVIAGTGAYVLGRVLRLSIVACALAGTVFELSGPFFVWLGWPIASVVSWSGWLFAAVILIVRGEHRIRDVAFFAVALAFAVFAGEPDTLVLLVLTLAVFAVVLLAVRARQAGGLGAIARPVVDLALALVTGACLGAPLLLPGLQLASGSIRNAGGSALNAQKALSVDYLFRTTFPWLIGTPVVHEYKYIGVIAIVLALAGAAFRFRTPEVAALIGVAIVTGVVVFVPTAISLINALPGLHAVRLPRALNFFAFALAMLSAVGLHVFVRSSTNRAVLRFIGAAFGLAGLALALFWLTGPAHLSALQAPIRSRGLRWLLIGVVVGLVAVAIDLVVVRHRSGPRPSRAPAAAKGRNGLLRRAGTGMGTGVLLLTAETVFLVVSGMGLWTSSATPFVPTPAALALQRAVGGSLVGLGTPQCLFPPGLGIPVNDNIIYGVRQLAVYDPLIPRSYYVAWQDSTGQVGGQPSVSHYCPGVTSASIARQYGVSYVLEPHGTAGPTGGVFDTRVGDEDLYRIPGAAPASLVPVTTAATFPPADAVGTPVTVTQPDPSSWRLTTHSDAVAVLRLHLTNVPGWHATIDGKALPLIEYSKVMLQARIPPGRHVIELHYWPSAFTAGIVLFDLAVIGLVAAPLVAAVRRRRSPPDPI